MALARYTYLPWLRRGIVYALVAVAVFQVAVWAFRSLSHFLGLLFLAWLFAISIEPVVERLSDGAQLAHGPRKAAFPVLLELARVPGNVFATRRALERPGGRRGAPCCRRHGRCGRSPGLRSCGPPP